MNSMFIIRGVTRDGLEVFYTGKAGQEFTTDKRGASFGYVSKTVAQHRAMNLNKMTQIHGIHFIVIPYDQITKCTN